jgi:phage gpG-like protein
VASTLPDGVLAVSLRSDAARVRAAVPRALAAVGVYVVSKIRQGFNQSQDPWGRAWAALKYRKGKPLLDRGLLMASFTYQVAGGAVKVGSANPVAPAHNEGATIDVPEKRRPYPMKPWVFVGVGGQTVFTRRIRAHKKIIPRRTMLAWSPEWVKGANDVAAGVLARAAGAG